MKWSIGAILTIITMMSEAQDTGLPTYKYEVQYKVLQDSIRIAYVDEGDPDAPVLLMVHGLGGYIKNWYFTIDELSQSFRCIAVDLPGYGLSSMRFYETHQADYLDFFAQVLDQFALELGLKQVTLLGHSMGGQISIIAALENPIWMDNLILAAPAGFESFTEEEANILISYGSAEAIKTHDETQVRAAYAVNFVEMPEIAEEMIQERLLAKKQPWFEEYAMVREMGVRGMLGHPVVNQLSEIDVPTLVLFGADDLLIPNRFFHKELTTKKILNIGRAIPTVKLSLINEAGHMLQMDNALEFNQKIIAFINQN